MRFIVDFLRGLRGSRGTGGQGGRWGDGAMGQEKSRAEKPERVGRRWGKRGERTKGRGQKKREDNGGRAKGKANEKRREREVEKFHVLSFLPDLPQIFSLFSSLPCPFWLSHADFRFMSHCLPIWI